MKSLPKWKRAIVENQAKKAIKKQYEDNEEEMQKIKNIICDYIENKDDSIQFNFIVMIIAEIIAGFEEQKDREFVMQSVIFAVSELDSSTFADKLTDRFI